ncbi:secretion-regulating guanine nucleotide exchange factor isoform X2 [Diceros bicornis minor]|uniref:secretion-regulating guanine nucleotide exchange factor isoform X2 n=1 Tax=Diceros bicornis minor TaxID=77932 RepID=UPI0026EF7ACB|nr:secretion-regulating guanine nucleotide exchange factor isoform X2 [Diceros bicornis minor]
MAREQSASEAGPAAAALFAWGANSYGQLGLGHKEDVLLPQQLNDFCKPRCVRRITGGGGHSAVVTDGGSLFVCGLNKDGQLGLGHTEDVLYFTPCKSLLGCPIQQVACGWDFTIILTESGQVLSCGSNSFGQLGVPHGPRRCVVPQAIELLREKVVSIAAGLRHALAATASGIVFQWGTGLASSGRRLCPVKTLPLFLTAKEPSRVTGLEDSKATCVVAGSCHSASLTAAGELYVWGSNKHGQLASQAAFLPVPQKIEAPCFQNEKVTAVWSGWTHLVAQTETGKVFTWGRADYGQLGRKLESHEGWKLDQQDSSLPGLRPRNSTLSSLHCLTGATEARACLPTLRPAGQPLPWSKPHHSTYNPSTCWSHSPGQVRSRAFNSSLFFQLLASLHRLSHLAWGCIFHVSLKLWPSSLMEKGKGSELHVQLESHQPFTCLGGPVCLP